MATTARAPGGRFASVYDTLELYGVVRDVALVASPEEPTSVSEAAWDVARKRSSPPNAPSARAIRARLAGAERRSFPWRELLELVFDESRDPERVHALRARVAADGELDERHVYYALRRAAGELGRKTLAPDAYVRVREELIARARQRRRGSSKGVAPAYQFTARLLPTVGQVERIAGDWDRALELAGLESRPEHGARVRKRGMPIAEALDRFADEADGWFCRREQLLEYARDRGITVAAREPGVVWREYVAAAKALRDARGVTSRGLPPPGVYPDYPGRGGGARRRPATKPPGYWTPERCVAAVKRYFDDPTTGPNRSQKGYLAWSVGRDDAPAPNAFAKLGGWKAVSAMARGRLPIPELPDGRSQRDEAVLAHLEAHGQIRTTDVQRLFNVGADQARRILVSLRKRGLIVLGSKQATGRGVFYVQGSTASQ